MIFAERTWTVACDHCPEQFTVGAATNITRPLAAEIARGRGWWVGYDHGSHGARCPEHATRRHKASAR